MAVGDEFDPRLLEGENAGSKRSQATEAEESKLDPTVSVRYIAGCVVSLNSRV
jgi:hypothetical protein